MHPTSSGNWKEAYFLLLGGNTLCLEMRILIWRKITKRTKHTSINRYTCIKGLQINPYLIQEVYQMMMILIAYGDKK